VDGETDRVMRELLRQALAKASDEEVAAFIRTTPGSRTLCA